MKIKGSASYGVLFTWYTLLIYEDIVENNEMQEILVGLTLWKYIFSKHEARTFH